MQTLNLHINPDVVPIMIVNNEVTMARGAVVPTDGATGYAKGCLFTQTDGGVGTTLYVNEGSATSADFNAK